MFFQVAFYWEGNDPENEGKITYSELLVSDLQNFVFVEHADNKAK
jgi:hypothetical protein